MLLKHTSTRTHSCVLTTCINKYITYTFTHTHPPYFRYVTLYLDQRKRQATRDAAKEENKEKEAEDEAPAESKVGAAMSDLTSRRYELYMPIPIPIPILNTHARTYLYTFTLNIHIHIHILTYT